MARWLALALLLTACAGDSDATPTPPPSVEPSAVGSTAPVTTSRVPMPTVEETVAAPPATDAAPATTSVASGVVPVGFDRTATEVTLDDGTVCELCLWVAARPEQRAQGLMGVTDLGGPDGMVFLYDQPSTSQFWMFGTPMPLSIAYFAADGSFVSASDMAPCLDRPPAECPRYPPAGPFTAAIEVPAGGLATRGITFGSNLTLLDTPC